MPEEVGVKVLVKPMREWNTRLSPVHLIRGNEVYDVAKMNEQNTNCRKERAILD